MSKNKLSNIIEKFSDYKETVVLQSRNSLKCTMYILVNTKKLKKNYNESSQVGHAAIEYIPLFEYEIPIL